MKLREIFRFELGYQARRVSTWLYFAVLGAFAFLWILENSGPDARQAGVLLDSPFVIAAVSVVSSAVCLLVAAAVAGGAAARDVQTRMHPLVYTAPVTKAEYLGGRFLAAFALNASILLAVPAGILLAVHTTDVDSESLGPFRPAAYLSAYLFIALPNAFVATAIQFSSAALSRQAIAGYLGGVVLILTAFAGLAAGARGLWDLGRLLDPIGLVTILTDRGDGWTPIEKNTRLVLPEGMLLWNRLLWFGIALGVLAVTHRRFRFVHHTASSWWRHILRRRDVHAPAPAATGIVRSTRASVPPVRLAFGLRAHARQTLVIAWDSLRTIAKSRSGLAFSAFMALVAGVLIVDSLGFMGVPLVARTDRVLTALTTPVPGPTHWILIPLLTVFWAGELVWREREAGLSEIVDATPVPEWVMLLGKFLGLGLVLAAWMALLMTTGMLVQVSTGHPDLEIGLYLEILFGLRLVEYLLLALFALAVYVVVNRKHIGRLVVLLSLLGMVSYGNGTSHNLLVPGSDPGWSYTEMRGFGASIGPWLWFELYWAAWALLLAVVARLSWVRGRESALGVRLRIARRRLTRPTARTAAAAVGLVLTSGGFIFYNTNVLNEYFTASDRMEQRAEYERRYGQYEGIPQPELTRTDLRVDIHPERLALDVRGTYTLVNGSAVAIDSIHLATEVEPGAVSFDRPAAPVLEDEDLGHRIYALEEPLQPDDSLLLDFEMHVEPRGFKNGGIDAPVAANGTWFTNLDWMPAIGYQPSRQIRSVWERRAHGLPPRPTLPSVYDVEERPRTIGAGRIAFEAVVGTDEGQVAVAPGILRRTWTEDGRRYFHYSTDAPIGHEYAFFSADYAVHEGQWNDVAIEVFHHPGHTANVDRMVRSVQASLSHYTEQFGPYPYGVLRLIERPGRSFGMHSDAIDISYDEGNSLLNPRDGPRGLDLPYYVVAHEVAHQWWGAQLSPARAEGAGVLVESLASYSAYQVVEETYGTEHLRRLFDQLRVAYQVPRARAAAPLLRADDPFLYYRKGPFALYALSRYIGREQVNGALRRLLEAHGSGAPPLPTSLDLYRELQAVTPDSFQSLLHDLFEANTFWELETKRATAEETDAGTWQVTLDVQARKVVVDSAGVETPVPMDDWVEIGVFAAAEEGEEPGEPFYLEMHRIRSSEQTITVTVPGEPAHAGIDPYHLLIDLETGDNTERVKIES